MNQASNFSLFITVLLSISLATTILAQTKPEINFETDKQIFIEPKDSDKRVSIKVIAKDGDASSYPVKIKVKDTKNGSAATSDFEYDGTSEIQIDKAGSSTTIWVTIKKDSDNNETDETVILEIEENDKIIRGGKNIHTIRISVIPDYELIRLTTGVDFDFEVDDTPISFYGELNGFMPDLFNNSWGISFEIFSNRFSNLDSMLSSERLNVRTGPLLINAMNSDTLTPYLRIGLRPTKQTVIRNYGVNISPIKKILDGGNAKIYLGLLVEGMVSSTSSTYMYDTLYTLKDTISHQEFLGFGDNKTIRSSRQNLFIGNFALTVPFRFVSEKIEIRIIPGLGASTATFLTNSGTRNSGVLEPYCQLDVNVLDRNFGITIGAEIKSGFLVNGNPLLNIYIAKSFDFTRFTKFE